MGDSFKDRIRAAVERHHDKIIQPKKIERTRRNKKPELKVVKELLSWMRQRGWSPNVVSSEYAWHSGMQTYAAQGVKVGTPDIVGCDNFGFSIFVEVKAKGRRCALRDSQRLFMEAKIQANAFCCVADSVQWLESVYSGWLAFRNAGELDRARLWCLNHFPKRRPGAPLFNP